MIYDETEIVFWGKPTGTRNVIWSTTAVHSRFNEPEGEMENCSLYPEFIISKSLKIVFFSQILNSRLDLYLKRNERREDDENLRFE